jgi:type II secretory pathway pseudopilin PulG
MEVLLGIVVVAFALYGVLDLMTISQKMSQRAQRRAAAVELARAKMAELQAAGFDAVAALWAKSPAAASQVFFYPATAGNFSPPYNAKPFRWQARFDRDPKTPDLMNVEVRVFWYPAPPGSSDSIEKSSVSVGGLLVKK